MDLNLKNKKVLITGSTKGIGLEIAKTFYKNGCIVGINGRDETETEKVVKGFDSDMVINCFGDVTNNHEAERIVNLFVKSFKNIDVLICNVGSGRSVKPGDEKAEDWTRMLSINLSSTTNMIEKSRSLIAPQGAIVCISSICGIETISGAPVAYSASKAALNSLVKTSARPFGELGIRINAIAPGNIIFKDSVWDAKLKDDPDSVNRMLKEEVPLGNLGSTEDIANLAVFLSSPLSSNITGEVIVTDGGQTRS